MGRAETRYLRLADRAPAPRSPDPGAAAGLGPFTGTWATTNPSLRGVRRLQLSDGEGGPEIRILGQIDEGFVDWGKVPVTGCFAGAVSSTAVEGVTASFDLDSGRCRLQVNLKLGVAVAGAFFEAGSRGERVEIFTRDFLARPPGAGLPPEDVLLAPTEARLRRMLGTPAAPGFEPFAGRWRNTVASSAGIVSLEITGDSEEAAVRVYGAGPDEPFDWGTARGQVFPCIEEDQIASACILARFDFGFMDSELQIRRNKGILAVTTFNTFRDGSGRSDYLTRELFYREAAAPPDREQRDDLRDRSPGGP